MQKVSDAVRRETLYIAAWELVGSAVLQAVFLIIGKWNYTVLLGNLLSGVVAVLNFFLMGLSVQKAVTLDEKDAKKKMKASQSLRMVMLFAAAALGAGLPCFHIVSALIPLFFPRIAVAFRPLFGKKDNTPKA